MNLALGLIKMEGVSRRSLFEPAYINALERVGFFENERRNKSTRRESENRLQVTELQRRLCQAPSHFIVLRDVAVFSRGSNLVCLFVCFPSSHSFVRGLYVIAADKPRDSEWHGICELARGSFFFFSLLSGAGSGVLCRFF